MIILLTLRCFLVIEDKHFQNWFQIVTFSYEKSVVLSYRNWLNGWVYYFAHSFQRFIFPYRICQQNVSVISITRPLIHFYISALVDRIHFNPHSALCPIGGLIKFTLVRSHINLCYR